MLKSCTDFIRLFQSEVLCFILLCLSSMRFIVNKEPVFLVDASIYIFRAWFSMPDSISDTKGNAINAVYGYLLFVAKFLNSRSIGKAAFAFDESLETCFRNSIYPAYKASRGLPDDNLALQLRMCRRLTEAAGLACFSSKRYEADDLIGSLAKQCRRAQRPCIILSRDKDLGQLLKEGDLLWDFSGQQFMGREAFTQKLGVAPERLVDYLALVGDSVDDIPGVSGLGPKAALVLLEAFGTLEVIYKNLEQVQHLQLRGAARVQQCLEQDREMAFISKRLASIYCDLKPVSSIRQLDWKGIDENRFQRALSRYHIQGRSRKAISNAFENLYR